VWFQRNLKFEILCIFERTWASQSSPNLRSLEKFVIQLDLTVQYNGLQFIYEFLDPPQIRRTLEDQCAKKWTEFQILNCFGITLKSTLSSLQTHISNWKSYNFLMFSISCILSSVANICENTTCIQWYI